MSDHHPSDRSAAFTGLILGAIAIAIIVVSIVKLTNKHLEGEGKAAAKPTASAAR